MITKTDEAALDLEARGMSIARVAQECRPRSHVLGTIAQSSKLFLQKILRPCALIGTRFYEALPTFSLIWWTNDRAPECLY